MPPRSEEADRRRVNAMKVHQWLPSWNDIQFDSSQLRARPPEDFYLFTIPAADLRALSGIFRRSAEGGLARSRDLSIQRIHDPERSAEIKQFVAHGFPWSALSGQKRASGQFDDLKKPGWLPTAIVVNILKQDETRLGRSVHANDLIDVRPTKQGGAEVLLPTGFSDSSWQPTGVSPIEVIDGQHRLWAFEERDFAPGFSLPVVAFHGLDISWQAYLFYTINIKPKKINASLAFDLYPLLRTEDWLERFDGHPIYRESRAQEITEALWSYPDSPWHERINMLGGRSTANVTQAAWIRSLLATFVKSYEPRRVSIGGLFGAPLGGDKSVLAWSRPQQTAFVILFWQELRDAIGVCKDKWAEELRGQSKTTPTEGDAAFSGRYSLLNTDQGVRGALAIANDLSYDAAARLNLRDIELDRVGDGTSEVAIGDGLDRFRESSVGPFMKLLAAGLASYDWRTAATPGLSDAESSAKARFRGNTGYRELRSDLLRHLATSDGDIGNGATAVSKALGFGR